VPAPRTGTVSPADSIPDRSRLLCSHQGPRPRSASLAASTTAAMVLGLPGRPPLLCDTYYRARIRLADGPSRGRK
jgi:hypothetical protein